MDNTNQTPSATDNLLGLIMQGEINISEAKGISNAELFILNLDENEKISLSLLLEIHKIAFGELYDWAGKWRTSEVTVGNFIPPSPEKFLNFIYQLFDEINFRQNHFSNKEELISLIAYSHHRLVFIHPFKNGNGRTARLFANFLAMKNGFKPIQLYYREGEDRKFYIEAIKEADKGNLTKLEALIRRELEPF